MKTESYIMNGTRLRMVPAIVFLLCTATAGPAAQALAASPYDPVALFLTWQHDPTTSMTIDWHTTPSDEPRERVLQFRKLDGDRYWRDARALVRDFPYSDRKIHRVELRNLEPATTYRFRFGEDSKEYRFRTMPVDLGEPVRFAVGGDTHHDRRELNRVVMRYKPDFILWGGDLAYANGDPRRIENWYGWFDVIKDSLIDDDGRVTPIVVAIGNHEVFSLHRLRNHWDEDRIAGFLKLHNVWDRKVSYFFDLFAFPGNPPYGVLDFGDYMSLVILDSDHVEPISGPQTAWLEAVLSGRRDRPHVFPIYHVPAYPSHRNFMAQTSVRVRENWVPLFEEYGVRVAFENHDHTYKRTRPIRAGRVVDDGVIYIGDGSWGRGPRDGNNRDAWYIQEFAAIRQGVIVTLNGDTQEFVVVSEDGDIIDTYVNRRLTNHR